MATIKLMNNKKLNRKPHNIEIAGCVALENGTLNIYHASFRTPLYVAYGLSIDKTNWIEAIKEDGKFVIGKLFKSLSDDDVIQIKKAGFYV